MASTSTPQFAAPSSSSAPLCSWDVFLSFYGKDTRKNFTSHLYSALLHAGLRTFMDEPELEKGEEISRGLLDAIHGSKIFIVVLSENYASSRWCLNELVEILTCKRTNGHVVIPVFYYVDPSELRHQKGSFGHALDFHKKRYSVDIVENWKSALAEIAELSGYHLKTDANENESYTVQEIVENVAPLISTKNLHLEDYLVGIDSYVEEIYKKLSMESNEVRAIGICGMGGIGKTTAAKTFYNKYFNIFDISCFVENVKQQSQEGSYLLPLLQQLSVELCGRMEYKVTDVKSGIRQLKQFLCNKKALIVLDDLDQLSYSELLVKVCNLVVAGSRIIFTTRDANLVNQLKKDISEVDIYMMRELEQVVSLELFSHHAFRKPTPPESFRELSVSFITYAGGLPLALKVLGSSLLGRTDVSFWKDKLEKVKEIGENDIQKILRMSYDELGDETQKAIFLDIAFFFVGRDKDEAVHIFKSCGFFPDAGIPVLVERCLLTITKDNMFQMHNLTQDMGNKVIREESEHGNCRRLYLGQENASTDLQKLEGTEKLEGLIVDQTNSPKTHLSAEILERMPKLRLLQIIGAHDIKGNFKNSLHELRCLWWVFCPWTCFPSTFLPQNMVSLDMYSKFKTLWKGVLITVISSISAKKHYFPPMATTSNQLASPYCSLSSSTSTSWDVFLSFYGKDTRRNFTSHLYSALLHAGLLTFMDEPELEKGEEISRGLLDAIHGSKIFIVVLSENYASSRWCLNELAEILTCKRTNGHVAIIPVFYYVDPSELRHHKGSFGHALNLHEKRYSVDIIEKWKSALAEIAELSGYHLKTDANENESKTIKKIVKKVTPLICKKDLHLEEYLVGIDSSVQEVYKKLSMEETNDVRAIGICGMGGIGKTTTAKAFYNKYFTNFDTSCFVDDVKQYSQGGSYLLPFLQQLSHKLLRSTVPDVTSGIRQLKQFFYTKKALIVVDDLDQSSYSEVLVRLCNMVSSGSRIIFTTRDANLVNQLKNDISEVDIYMMGGLKQVDSLELFSHHAFRNPTPPESFKDLSLSFLTYAGGLPLALKVLGSSLLGRTDVSFWKSKLEKVKKFGDNNIQQILRMSYDELGDETQKAIFLDIAFFFVGRDKDEAVHIFNSCDFFPDADIPVLVERCLLTITENNMFQMHNLIQEMGNKVSREESRCLYLGRENASKDLQKLEETEKLEGLIIDRTISPKSHFSAKIWERMPKLRLLKIIGGHEIGGNFKNSFHELRCMCWDSCHWTHLPSSFRPQKLVSLEMQNSKLKILWKGVMPSVNLKTINLSNSINLKTTPDFTNLTLVDKLVLRGCTSLLKVHPSIGQLTSLSHLDFGFCRTLTRLPEQLGDMKCLKMLDASYTLIEQLPDSIAHLKDLVELKLRRCKKLRNLPGQIGNMESLELFDASDSAIEHLPDTFVDLVNLKKLHLVGCKNLTSLPKSLWKLKVLRVLSLSRSPKLEQLPEQLGKMQCLEKLYASDTAIEELPKSVGLLSRLEGLHLDGCKKIKNLPSSIWNLTSLKGLSLHQQNTNKIILPDIVKDMKLESLVLSCNVWLPGIRSFSSLVALELWYESQIFSSDELYSLSKLSNLHSLTLKNCTSRECSFSEFPVNLQNLLIINTTVETLPELSSLKQLKELYLQSGINLQSIPPLPPHLEKISFYDCKSLQDIPDLSMLKELQHLAFTHGNNLKSISLKQSFLQVGQHNLHIFQADIPDREVAEWFSYKSSGNKLSFTIPQNSGDNFFGLGLWIVYKCKYTDGCTIRLRAVITNKTKNIKEEKDCRLPFDTGVGEVLSRVECMKYDSMKSGDRIKISFQSCPAHLIPNNLVSRPWDNGRGEVQVKMCGAHLIPNNLVKICDYGWSCVFQRKFYLEDGQWIEQPTNLGVIGGYLDWNKCLHWPL